MGSIPGSGRFAGGGIMATHSSILARRIPWTEEPGGLQSKGCKELDMTEATEHTHIHTHTEFIYFPEVSEYHSSHLGFHLE